MGVFSRDPTPQVRDTVRRLFRHHAVLSTAPTTKGKRELTWSHPYYGLVTIHRKPVPTFLDEPRSLMQVGVCGCGK